MVDEFLRDVRKQVLRWVRGDDVGEGTTRRGHGPPSRAAIFGWSQSPRKCFGIIFAKIYLEDGQCSEYCGTMAKENVLNLFGHDFSSSHEPICCWTPTS
jgi:hypothetical protein